MTAPAGPVQTGSAVLFLLALVALAQGSPVDEAPAADRAQAPMRDNPVVESAAARDLREGRRIDLNRASLEDLTLLPRIGPALAGRIVEDRTKNGPLERVEDLVRVRGIGPKMLERLRPLVRVDPKDAEFQALSDRKRNSGED